MARNTKSACLRVFLLIAWALGTQPALALTWKGTWALDLPFASGSVGLPEIERGKLGQFLTQIEAKGVCIEFVIAHGSAQEVEEGDRAHARALAMRRAEYVANLVRVRGVRAELIHAAVPVAVLDNSRTVSVEVVGFMRGAPTCQ